GVFIDIGMLEPNACTLGESIVAASAGVEIARLGNDDSGSTGGVYRCAGDDRWIAISCEDAEQRHALKIVAGHDVAAYARSRDRDALAQELQDAGIPAGPVLHPGELLSCEQFVSRGTFEAIEHEADVGPRLHLGPPWSLSRTPASTLIGAPVRMGRDTDDIL